MTKFETLISRAQENARKFARGDDLFNTCVNCTIKYLIGRTYIAKNLAPRRDVCSRKCYLALYHQEHKPEVKVKPLVPPPPSELSLCCGKPVVPKARWFRLKYHY